VLWIVNSKWWKKKRSFFLSIKFCITLNDDECAWQAEHIRAGIGSCYFKWVLWITEKLPCSLRYTLWRITWETSYTIKREILLLHTLFHTQYHATFFRLIHCIGITSYAVVILSDNLRYNLFLRKVKFCAAKIICDTIGRRRSLNLPT